MKELFTQCLILNLSKKVALPDPLFKSKKTMVEDFLEIWNSGVALVPHSQAY